MTDAIPQVAYLCPHCRQASATINRVEPFEQVTAYTYSTYDERHHPASLPVKTRKILSRWECVLCGKDIEDLEQCLVQVTITKLHTEPTGADVLIEPDPEWLKKASKDRPPGNPAEDDAEDLGQEPDY